MKAAKWFIFALMLVCGGFLLVRLALHPAVASRLGLVQSGGIRVIGGADGPTAVFVAKKTADTAPSAMPALPLFPPLLAAWLMFRRKTRGTKE